MDATNMIDLIGYSAGLMTIATFAQKRMLTMRMCAISANLLFIGYGALAGVHPVALLHVILLPLNVMRLFEGWRGSRHPLLSGRAPPLKEQWQHLSR